MVPTTTALEHLPLRVLYPNLAFEEVIAGQTSGPNASLRRIVDSLKPLIGIMGTAGDVVVVSDNGRPAEIPDVLSHLEYLTVNEILERVATTGTEVSILPWGWDSSARDLADRLEARSPRPSAESVMAVNSRLFSAEFDVLADAADSVFFDGQFGQICKSCEQFQTGIEHLAAQQIDEWFAKPAWSTAGRSRLVGRSDRINENQKSWLRKQLTMCQYVYLEPCLPVIRECGIQLEISATSDTSAAVTIIGATELITDRTGRYRGSIMATDVEPFWQPAIEHAKWVGQRAAKLGYFGPLGIDSMQIELADGQRLLRLCNDINGRLTMGRLGLGLWQAIGSENTGIWLHSGIRNRPEDEGTCRNLPAANTVNIVDTVRVSPRRIGGYSTAVDSCLYVTNGLQTVHDVVQAVRQYVRLEK